MMKMKKYSILVAAFAVLAFVGCKKDNNGSLVADQNGMITLEMSGETHQDNGKQSFFGTANRIFFNEGDQMIVNGSVCNVTPQAVAGDELATEFQSYKAKVAILAEYAYTPLYAMYPAEAFTLGTAADYSDMTVEMFNNVDLFTVADAAVTLGSATYYQPWPMTAYLENLNTPRIQLKNNIALVTPSVKFGYPFVNQFVQDNNLNITVDPNKFGMDYEQLRQVLDKANIESRPLWKPMHMQPVFKDAPAYVNGVSESLFKVGLCLPSGPMVTDEDLAYIAETIKNAKR